jgi:tetratricopeptide (TPR) repeat protein
MVACKGNGAVAILPAVKPLWAYLLAGILGATWAAAQGLEETGSYHLLVANLLSEEGDYRGALESFEEAIALSPDDVYARLEYGRLLMRLGRTQEAVTQATVARQMAPHLDDVLLFYSEALMRLAEEDPSALEKARLALEEIRARQPGNIEAMVTLGQIYLGESRPDEAAAVFRDLLSRRAGNRMVFSLLIDSLMRAERPEQAEQAMREALEIDPGFSRARLSLAQAQSERGDHAGAAKTLEGGPEEVLTDPEVRRRLAFELHQSGQYSQALQLVEEMLAEDPGYYPNRYLQALALAALGREEEAIVATRDLLRSHPMDLDLGILLARLQESRGEPEAAEETLQAMENRLRSTGKIEDANQARIQRGLLLMRLAHWTKVVALFEPLMGREIPAADADMAMILAEALVRVDRQDEALGVLSRLEPGTTAQRRGWARQGEILYRLDRNSEAEEVLARLAEEGSLEDLTLLAEVYQSQERYELAIPVLERALKLDPNSTSLLFWLAAAHERSGGKRQAEDLLQQLLAIDPHFAPALNYLGYMWAEAGENLGEALALVEQAVELEPDNGAFMDSLGWAHFQLGQYEEARGFLEKAAALVGDDAVVLEHLGDLYVALGSLEEARIHYERALGLEAENSSAVREKLNRLPLP